MPPLSKTEQEHILNEISQSLSETPYACSTLTQLNGGTVSFVYRGLLRGPLEDGSKGIIVKKTPNHVAINRDFLLDAGRCVRFHHFPYFTSFENFLEILMYDD